MVEDNENPQTDDSGSKKRFGEAEFAAARELYELGKAGIAELAEEYGISRQTLSRRFKDVGAIKGSRAHEVAAAAGQAAKATVERYSEQRAIWIEETRIEGLKAIKQARLIGQKIAVDALRAGAALGTVDDDLRAANRLNKLLLDNINGALAILNANEHVDDADLPVLTIEDLTDQDILDHHIATGALDEDATLEDINTEL